MPISEVDETVFLQIAPEFRNDTRRVFDMIGASYNWGINLRVLFSEFNLNRVTPLGQPEFTHLMYLLNYELKLIEFDEIHMCYKQKNSQ